LRCLIIAAGRGSRLARLFPLKPLVPVAGTALLERVMAGAAAAGIHEFCVVSGHRSEEIKRFVGDVARRRKLDAEVIFNPDWERENGFSVLAARAALPGEFILLMADHLFDGRILDDLLAAAIGPGQVVLAVDRRVQKHPHVDLDDVTRVRTRAGRIVDIGKNIPVYDAFDTGIFRCTPALFAALEESVRRGDFSLSGGLRVLAGTRDALALDSGDRFWIDVDDERALALAEDVLAAAAGARA
jgi:1L-myo-inositol 1-phosphate cytidylyltransferase